MGISSPVSKERHLCVSLSLRDEAPHPGEAETMSVNSLVRVT